MKVFICWSEERSRVVAENLRDWLKRVIQQLRPFLSTQDIRAGQRWQSEISGQLSETKFGILCLTKENLDSQWINFEAGALSKTIDDKTFVCPYFIGGLLPADVRDPLGQFQGVPANKEGTLNLLKTINSALPGEKLDEKVLEDAFAKYWPDLKIALDNLPSVKGQEKPKRTTDDMIEEILSIVRGMTFERQRYEGNLDSLISKWAQGSLPSGSPAITREWLQKEYLSEVDQKKKIELETLLSMMEDSQKKEELKKIRLFKIKKALRKKAEMP